MPLKSTATFSMGSPVVSVALPVRSIGTNEMLFEPIGTSRLDFSSSATASSAVSPAGGHEVVGTPRNNCPAALTGLLLMVPAIGAVIFPEPVNALCGVLMLSLSKHTASAPPSSSAAETSSTTAVESGWVLLIFKLDVQELETKACWGELCDNCAPGRRARAISSTATYFDLENACNTVANDY
jgi:hypothetical protein